MSRDALLLSTQPEDIARAAAAVRARTDLVPRIALILGSGLGNLSDVLEDRIELDAADIPGYPHSTVAGHAGKLVVGRLGDIVVAAQKGRFHLYEGHAPALVVFPLRLMHALGARALVVTNAAGGVNRQFRPGDLMLITDHVNFQFRSPLRGRGPLVDGDRFVDLSEPYSKRFIAIAQETARAESRRLMSGVYWGNLGPVYETPAEVRMVERLGGDAVGMSTVAEVIAARHLGMEVLGLACISNLAAGFSQAPLTHTEVLETTERVRETVSRFLIRLLPRLVA